MQTINADKEAYRSRKLSYKSEQRPDRIDVEFLSLEESTSLYLVIHSTPLTDPTLTITIDDEMIQTLVEIREGGQRLYIPLSIQELLVDTLLNGKPVTLTLPGYRTTLYPSNFPKLYKRLAKPTSTSLLFQRTREKFHYF